MSTSEWKPRDPVFPHTPSDAEKARFESWTEAAPSSIRVSGPHLAPPYLVRASAGHRAWINLECTYVCVSRVPGEPSSKRAFECIRACQSRSFQPGSAQDCDSTLPYSAPFIALTAGRVPLCPPGFPFWCVGPDVNDQGHGDSRGDPRSCQSAHRSSGPAVGVRQRQSR